MQDKVGPPSNSMLPQPSFTASLLQHHPKSLYLLAKRLLFLVSIQAVTTLLSTALKSRTLSSLSTNAQIKYQSEREKRVQYIILCRFLQAGNARFTRMQDSRSPERHRAQTCIGGQLQNCGCFHSGFPPACLFLPACSSLSLTLPQK